MAFGDEKDGTLFLWDVPDNLKMVQADEEENIEKFWDNEVKKCLFVVEQRQEKQEQFNTKKAEDEKKKALDAAADEVSEEQK